MDSNKLLSVVIPCYNAEKYVAECLNSVIQQEYRPIEIICVDDGSTDNTRFVLGQFRKAHGELIQIIETPNNGAAAARNLGLERATGEYLQFLDADDLLLPGKFKEQIALINDADMVVSDRIIKDLSLSQTLEEITFAHIEQNPLAVAARDIIITGNPIYRTSKVREINGYREDLKSAQDWDFHLRMILAGARVKYCKGFYFLTRKVPGSVSSNWISVSDQCCIVIESLKEELQDHPLMTEEIKAHFSVIYYNSSINASDAKKLSNYFRELKYWSAESVDFLSSKIKRIIAETLGLKTLITLERLRN